MLSVKIVHTREYQLSRKLVISATLTSTVISGLLNNLTVFFWLFFPKRGIYTIRTSLAACIDVVIIQLTLEPHLELKTVIFILSEQECKLSYIFLIISSKAMKAVG